MQGKCAVSISCSYLEIYNETFTDLLNPGGIVKLHEDARRRMGVQILGSTEKEVTSAAETFDILSQGSQYRHVAATNMNKESSRSHSVFSLKITTAESKNGTKSVRTSRFNLIDLAGSERQKQAKTEGVQLKEASSINKSLSSLGNVINALVDNANGKERHIHYRDSKLTFLLKDSLGGNSKTCIIANVSPAGKNSEETLSTLLFAQRAKKIKNAAVVNENTSGDMAALQERVQELQQENDELKAAAADGPVVQQSQSAQEMEKLLLQGLTDREKLKEDIDVLTEQLAATNANAANVVKAVQAKDMVIKFRDNEVSQLKKRLSGDKSEYEFEHSKELEVLRKFKSENPELRKALYDIKQLQKKLKTATDQAKHTQEMADTRAYNEGLQKQCAALISEKTQIESNFSEISDIAEGLMADKARLTSDNREYQEAIQELEGNKAELETMMEQTMGMLETSQNDHMSCKEELTKSVVENTTLQLQCTTIAKDHEDCVADLNKSRAQTKQVEEQLSNTQHTLVRTQESLSQHIEEHEKQILELNKDIKNAKAQTEADKQIIEAQNTEIKLLKQTMSDAALEGEKMQAELQKNNEQLKEALEKQEQTAADLQQDNDEMILSMEEAGEQISTLAAEKQAVEEELETAKNTVADFESKLAVVNEDIKGVRSELSASQEQAEALDAEKTALTNTLQSTRGEMEAAAAENTKMQGELNERIAGLTATNAETVAALEQERTAVADCESRLESLGADLTATKEALEKQEQTAADLQQDNDEMNLSMEEAGEQISTLAAEKQAVEEELETAKNTVADFESKLAVVNEDIKGVRSELSASQEQAEALDAEKTALTNTLQSTRGEMEAAAAENTKMQGELNERIAGLTATNAETVAALEQERTAVADCESRLESLGADLTATKEALEKQEQTAADLQQDMAAKLKAVEVQNESAQSSLNAQLESLTHTNDDAQARILALSQEVAISCVAKDESAARVIELEHALKVVEAEAAEQLSSAAMRRVEEAAAVAADHENTKQALDTAVKEVSAQSKMIDSLKEQLEAAQREIIQLSGHSNTKQKIQHLEKVKRELTEIKEAKQHLEQELEKYQSHKRAESENDAALSDNADKKAAVATAVPEVQTTTETARDEVTVKAKPRSRRALAQLPDNAMTVVDEEVVTKKRTTRATRSTRSTRSRGADDNDEVSATGGSVSKRRRG